MLQKPINKKCDSELINIDIETVKNIEQILDFDDYINVETNYSFLNDFCILFALDNYKLFKITTKSKDNLWGLYKKRCGTIRKYLPCYFEFSLDKLELIEHCNVFKSIYDTLYYAKTNNYSQNFIDKIIEYSEKQINMNYIV